MQQTTTTTTVKREEDADKRDPQVEEETSCLREDNNRTTNESRLVKIEEEQEEECEEEEEERMADSSNNNNMKYSSNIDDLPGAGFQSNNNKQINGTSSSNSNCCAGCREPIRDKFIFSVIDLHWHQDCVQCSDCSSKLNDRCFTVDGKLYCRPDYRRRFGPKCFACREPIDSKEFVQRIKGNRVYHLKCFTCNDCNRQLKAGEQLHLIEGGKRLLCKRDFYQSISSNKSALNHNHQAHGFSSSNNQATTTVITSQANNKSNGFCNDQQNNNNNNNNQQTYYTLMSSRPNCSIQEQHKFSCSKLRTPLTGSGGGGSLSGDEHMDEELAIDDLHNDDDLDLDHEEGDEELEDEDYEQETATSGSHHLDEMGRLVAVGVFSNDNLDSANGNSKNNGTNFNNLENEENSAAGKLPKSRVSGRQNRGPVSQAGGVGGAKRKRRRRQRAQEQATGGNRQRGGGAITGGGGKKLAGRNGESILNGGVPTSAGSILAPGGCVDSSAALHQQQAKSVSSAASDSSSASSGGHTHGAHNLGGGAHHPNHHPNSNHQHNHHNHHQSHHHHAHHHGQQLSGTPTGGGSSGSHKPTRVRTVLNEKQLATLRDCYAHNPRPDALMKDQLVELTGLSPRVIRVWFQNKRCKDKKKSIMFKQLQQHEKDGRHLAALTLMRGVPLVATSPIQYDDHSTVSSIAGTHQQSAQQQQQQAQSQSQQPQIMDQLGGGEQLGPSGSPLQSQQSAVEIHAYAPPWKSLIEYHSNHVNSTNSPTSGQQPDTNTPPADSRLNPASPRYQQIMSQVHGYAPNRQPHEILGEPLESVATSASSSSLVVAELQPPLPAQHNPRHFSAGNAPSTATITSASNNQSSNNNNGYPHHLNAHQLNLGQQQQPPQMHQFPHL